jgi:Holliday junction resolvase RusA-like endonuclease
MPCKHTNAKGGPCKRPTKGDCCASHQQLGGKVKGLPGLPADYKPSKWFAPIRAIASVVRPITNRIAAPIKGPQAFMPSKLEKFLKSQEGKTITKLELGRVPIDSRVKKALDVMSLGKFSGKAKELDYEKVYHQFMLVTMSDGKTYKIEKNETVQHFPAKKSDYSGDIFDIPLNKQLTLAEMIDAAEDGNEERFWKYRADSDNCQSFTHDMIVKNGLLPDDSPLVDKQDAKKLVDSLPAVTHGVPNFVTDLANIGRRVISGDGTNATELHSATRTKIRAELFRN